MFSITRDVVIRTNSEDTALVINDKSTGSIKHYDVCASVNIIECHTASYHEFGVVPFIEISEGHLVLEEGADVNAIHVDKDYTDETTLTKTPSTFADVEISIDSSVATPKFSRDPVDEIAAEGTKICTLDIAGDTQIVKLTKQGIEEQITVTNISNTTKYLDESSATADTKKAAAQFANTIGGTKGTDYTINENREIQFVNSEVAVIADGGKSATEAIKTAGIKGDGKTKETAFVIKDSETYTIWTQMADESKMIGNANRITYVMFEGIVDLSEVDFDNIVKYNITNVDYNGNNATVINVDAKIPLLGSEVYGKNNKLYNLDIKDSKFPSTLFWWVPGSLEIDNVDMDNCETRDGSLIMNVEDMGTNNDVIITNCHVSRAFVQSQYLGGGFVGGVSGTHTGKLVIDNCSFQGTINCVAGIRNAAFVGGNNSTATNTFITNSEVKDGTVFRLMSNSCGVWPYANFNNDPTIFSSEASNNKFNATYKVLSGYNLSNLNTNGFFTVNENGGVKTIVPNKGSNIIKQEYYEALDASMFNITTDGTFKINYTGSNNILINAQVNVWNVDVYNPDHSFYLGGYTILFGDGVTKKLTSSDNVLDTGVLSFSSYKNDSSQNYNDAEYMIKDGILYVNTSINKSGHYKIINETTHNIVITINEVDSAGHVVAYVTKTIALTPAN